ncbi:MAG: DNA gyrase inhibitor YacG [Planctomycetota bacterium]
MSCPRCGQSLTLTLPERPSSAPFCSERCRLLDLGAWHDEAYRVAGSAFAGDSEADLYPET